MGRDYIHLINDMISSIVKIENYTSIHGIHQLFEEGIYYDDVLRNLEILGEASKNIPETIKSKYPEIAWKEVYGLRNIISHAYFGIDVFEIEYIVSNDLSILKAQFLTILHQKS
jgi:uncharacterized protein with HEPN domain